MLFSQDRISVNVASSEILKAQSEDQEHVEATERPTFELSGHRG